MTDITQFFDYYRRRDAAIRTFPRDGGRPAGPLSPEQHILISALLDSLASHWARARSVTHKSHRTRLAKFLERHGGHASYRRVSSPYLLRDASRRADIDERDVKLLRQALPVVGSPGRYFSWSDELELDELSDQLLARGAKIPPHLLSQCLIGGVLYKEHRCVWLHVLDEGDVLDWSNSQRTEPHYASHGLERNHRRRLVLPSSFLLDTCSNAIASLESEFVDTQASPFAS